MRSTKNNFNQGDIKMANKDTEIKATENAAISDEELDNVSGGLGSVNLGSRAVNTLDKNKFKVVDNSRCPTCGNLLTSIAYQKDDPSVVTSNSSSIRCEKCNTLIVKKINPNAEELM
jgi:uncharacterized protein with PIN domain